MTEERCCENCGNEACANNYVAVLWSYCVADNFTKHWKPKGSKKNKAEGHIAHSGTSQTNYSTES